MTMRQRIIDIRLRTIAPRTQWAMAELVAAGEKRAAVAKEYGVTPAQVRAAYQRWAA